MHTTNGQEAWRVLGIMAEFAAATERLRGIRPAVSMFGSARIKPGHPYYRQGRAHRAPAVGRGLRGDFRRRSGTDGSGKQGAHSHGRSPAIGLNILLPHEQSRQRIPGRQLQNFRYFFARKMMFVRFASAYVVLPGGFGTHRRALRMPDARADRQEPAHSDHPRGRRFLARAPRLDARAAGRAKA